VVETPGTETWWADCSGPNSRPAFAAGVSELPAAEEADLDAPARDEKLTPDVSCAPTGDELSASYAIATCGPTTCPR